MSRDNRTHEGEGDEKQRVMQSGEDVVLTIK